MTVKECIQAFVQTGAVDTRDKSSRIHCITTFSLEMVSLSSIVVS